MMTPGEYLVILNVQRVSSVDGKPKFERVKRVSVVEEGITREALLEQLLIELDGRFYQRYGESVSTKIPAIIDFFYAEPN